MAAPAGARRSHLSLTPPPAGTEPAVLGLVERNAETAGEVVRVLPELRPSIQIMIGDPYWLRPAEGDDRWRCLPRVALWGPQVRWKYGHAARHIRCYAVAVTPGALPVLTGEPAAAWLDRIEPLLDHAPDLAEALDPRPHEGFQAWVERITPHLIDLAGRVPPDETGLAQALDVLATAEGDAVARAARRTGLSVRHFRRRFAEVYGLGPKAYQRHLRVDRMLRQLHQWPWDPDGYGEVPIAFADQPHAIREFRALTGLTPHQYLAAKAPGDATLRSVPVAGIEPPGPGG